MGMECNVADTVEEKKKKTTKHLLLILSFRQSLRFVISYSVHNVCRK